ncbi:MAG: ECF-type sigma factor [Gemmataceae bacterium]
MEPLRDVPGRPSLPADPAVDLQSTERLFAQVYDELRRLAVLQLAQEKPGHTLQPTALVHEAFLRLTKETVDPTNPQRWDGYGHFIAAAAEAMRRILIESARRKMRKKHGGGHARVPLDPDQIAEPELAEDLLALDSALSALAAVEPTVAELVKLRYFGGLTNKEAAGVLGIAPRTADAYWAYARAWLLAEIRRQGDSGGTAATR